MSCSKNTTTTISIIGNSSGNMGGYNSSTSNNMTITDSNRAQYNNNLTQSNPTYKQSNCRKIVNKYPSFTPVIYSLSVTSSLKGVYSVVYVNGSNFLPPTNGTTYVNFGSFTKLPIIYFSSSSLSFVVPLNAKVGDYSVVVVNVYNGNFSPQINFTYAGKLNVSNAINYTIL
jgi:hypothetical protein